MPTKPKGERMLYSREKWKEKKKKEGEKSATLLARKRGQVRKKKIEKVRIEWGTLPEGRDSR